MPSHVPRESPTRKKNQLLNRSEDLRLAIFHNKSVGRINKLAERFKDANLSLIKAKIHNNSQLDYQNKKSRIASEKLENEKFSWETKSLDTILEEFKKTTKSR